MHPRDVREYISPLFNKSTEDISISCPLHYFAVTGFKQTLLKSGYELAHPEDLYHNKSSKDFINVERDDSSYQLDFITTLNFSELENYFHTTFKNKYKGKYILIQGSKILIKSGLDTVEYEEIKNTIPENVVSILESSLWNYKEFCNRYAGKNLSNTLGLLLYAPPGYGKSFILRSYLNKLITERDFTVVQVYNRSISQVNLSQLLDSCSSLFPCILFIEDIDLKFQDRRDMQFGNIAGDLLETLEGLNKAENVVLIATSNSVDVIDKALLRPGRFDYLIEIERPTTNAKKLALTKYEEDVDFELPDNLNDQVVEVCETFAELKGTFQYIALAYMTSGNFPSIDEIYSMTNRWKDTRLDGVPVAEARNKVGLI